MSERPNEIEDIKLELLALKAVCAALIAEIAILSKDPPVKLGSVTASLQGVMHAIAGEAGSPAGSKAIDLISEMAEVALVRR